jgi:hypothetical protein
LAHQKPLLYQFLIAVPVSVSATAMAFSQASANSVVIFRPTIYTLGCRSEQETMILSADLLEHMDSLFLTGNEIGDLEPWLNWKPWLFFTIPILAHHGAGI